MLGGGPCGPGGGAGGGGKGQGGEVGGVMTAVVISSPIEGSRCESAAPRAAVFSAPVTEVVSAATPIVVTVDCAERAKVFEEATLTPLSAIPVAISWSTSVPALELDAS